LQALTIGTAAAAAAPRRPRAQALSGKLSFVVAEYSPKTRPFWQAQVAAFTADHPGTEIALEVVNWQQMHDSTVQRIASGSLPDLVNTATIWLPEWVEADALQPVSDAIVSDAVKRDMVPTLYEKGALYKGKSWGLPIAAAARGLFYNKKLLADAGISEVPPHWPAFRDAVAAVKEKTGQFGYAFDAKGVQAFRYFGFFLWNNGGDFFNADGTAAFNGKPGVEALQFLADLAKTPAVPAPTGNTVQDLEPIFKGGRLAMLVDGNYFVARLRADAPTIEFGVAPVPTSGLGVKPVVWGVTDTLVIGKRANQPLAKAFIDHIYQTAVRTEFDANEGFLPVLQSETALPRFADDPVLKSFTAMLPNARFDPLNPNYSKMQELVKTAMQQALTGRDAKAALDEAAQTFNKLAAP
jgi:multiple sugar transport system substrate-binding protein